MRKGLARSVPWIAGALVLFVLLSSLRIGTAALLCGHAADQMAAWSKEGSGPDVAAMDEVSRVLEWAQRIAPGNPDVYDAGARLALWRATQSGDAAAKAAVLREGSVQARRVLALRPASPYGWALLLRFKNDQGEYDAEFHRAIERVTALGPWEPGLQAVVLDAGLSAWDALPEVERERVRAAYRRGLKREAGAMLDVVFAHRNGCVVSSGYDGCAR